MTRKTAEDQWKRTALQETVDYFEDESVRRDFMRDALAQFCAGDTAKISNSASTVGYETDMFASQYKSNYEGAKQKYLADQRSKGTLSPVFMDRSEREERLRRRRRVSTNRKSASGLRHTIRFRHRRRRFHRFLEWIYLDIESLILFTPTLDLKHLIAQTLDLLTLCGSTFICSRLRCLDRFNVYNVQSLSQ